MEDQLQLMNEMDRRFSIGDEVEAQILSISGEAITVSLVGYKSDGIIPLKELTYAEDLENILNGLKVGDRIKAKVIKLKNDDNYVVLSRLEYLKEESFETLATYFEEKKSFEINITKAIDKGLEGYFKGVRIFIPSSQIDIKFVNDLKEYVGRTLTVRLIDFSNENRKKAVASSRVILEEAKSKKETETWSQLILGDTIKVQVKRFTKFGAFAEIGGVDGLIHLSELSWKHVKSPADVISIGDVIDAKIINIDRETKKLALSIKALTVEPWSNIEVKYPVGSTVLGKVVRIADFGAFVELEPGVDGLVHISKISHEHVKNPNEVLTIGDDVKCVILEVNAETKKISLSIKDCQ